jgi:hypothetical protein
MPTGILPGAALAASLTGLEVTAQQIFDPGTPADVLGPRMPFSFPEEMPQNPANNYFLGGNVPYIPPTQAQHGDYNIKIGRAEAAFYAALSATYNDNLFLGSNGSEGGFSFSPSAGMAVNLPINKNASFQFDVGVGYAFYPDHDELNYLTLSPGSRFAYRFLIGDVMIIAYDSVSSSSGGYARSEIVGNGTASPVDFNQFQNIAGLTANWMATEDLSLSAGYSYYLQRSINDSYSQLDSDSHRFNVAAYQKVGPQWTVGVYGGYGTTDYLRHIQNDSTFYSVGPLVAFRPSRYLSFNGSVGYTVVNYEQSGLAGLVDTSDFSGLTYQFGIAHTISKHVQHAVEISDGVNQGLGSNFTESFTVVYSLGWQVTTKLSSSFHIAYEDFKQSDARVIVSPTPPFVRTVPLDGQTVRIGVSFGYPISRKLSSALSYEHYTRSANLDEADYDQNVVTLSLSYRF